MPKQYEAIRDNLHAKGMSLKEAKGHAARIYNAQRGSKPPVTGRAEGEKGAKHLFGKKK
jgi:hypothetical protein